MKTNKFIKQCATHGIIILVLAIIVICTKQPDVSNVEATTSEAIIVEEKIESYSGRSTEVQTEEEAIEIPMYPEFTYNKEWTEEEEHMLAKIAMAEAEGESIQTKTLIIMTVLNRVESDKFPDTIEEVIFQKVNGVYQFSPVIPGGRWYTTEPNEDCYEAVEVVKEAMYDYSGGATYFEACHNKDNWHSRNLEFLYECGSTRFYK